MKQFKVWVGVGLALMSFSACANLPSEYDETYQLSGKVSGTLEKSLECEGNLCTLSSEMKVKKGFIRRTIEREATLSVVDDKVVETGGTVGSGDDAQSVVIAAGEYSSAGAVFVLRHQLINNQALGALDIVGKEGKVNKVTFSVIQTDASLTVPAGTFNTVVVAGKSDGEQGFEYWFDVDNDYLLVQTVTTKNGDPVLTASLQS